MQDEAMILAIRESVAGAPTWILAAPGLAILGLGAWLTHVLPAAPMAGLALTSVGTVYLVAAMIGFIGSALWEDGGRMSKEVLLRSALRGTALSAFFGLGFAGIVAARGIDTLPAMMTGFAAALLWAMGLMMILAVLRLFPVTLRAG